MKTNFEVFEYAVQKALASDTEILIPNFIKSLKELICDEVVSLDINKIFNELFYLNIFVYYVTINKRFKEQAPNFTDKINEIAENFLRNRLSDESIIIDIMIELNIRLLEISEKHREFINKEGKPEAVSELSQFFIEKILGNKFKKNICLEILLFNYFGVSIENDGKYFGDIFHQCTS